MATLLPMQLGDNKGSQRVQETSCDLEPLLPFGFLPRIIEHNAQRELRPLQVGDDEEQVGAQLSLWQQIGESGLPGASRNGKSEMHSFLQQNHDDRIVYMVPKNRYAILDRHFPSWVARNQQLRLLSFALADRRILRLGQVVQLTRLELAQILAPRFPRSVLRRIECLEAKLDTAELRLGMAAPNWKSPGGLLNDAW